MTQRAPGHNPMTIYPMVECQCGTLRATIPTGVAFDWDYQAMTHRWNTVDCSEKPDWGGDIVFEVVVGHAGESNERELREKFLGEQQPDPTPTHEPSAHDMVIVDLDARRAFGLAKYGSLLQPSNGRDNLQDAYEEVLDLAVYLRNEIERRKSE